jgi:hypothetical protein
MKVKNYLAFAMHEYNNSTSTQYELGDIVIRDADPIYNEDAEIGVIIQVHDEWEYRTDMFGNCHHSELRIATLAEVTELRPKLLTELALEPVESVWDRLGGTPVNDDGEIDEDFVLNWYVFEKGTDREDIWHIIEEDYDVRVYDLMHPNEIKES